MVKQYAEKVFPDFNKIRIVSEKEIDESRKLLEDKMQEIRTPRAAGNSNKNRLKEWSDKIEDDKK